MSTEKKPKVVAFYREHPTIQMLAEKMFNARKEKMDRSEFHKKALDKIRQEADKESAELWKEMNNELVTLGLITQEEVDAGHLHIDADTMTVQRCQGHHSLAELLGFQL